MDVVTMIVMTLITPVFSPDTIIRRFFTFFYMSIPNDTSSPSPCAEILSRAHLLSSILYYIDYIINEINAVRMLMMYECNIIIVKDYVSRVLKLHL